MTCVYETEENTLPQLQYSEDETQLINFSNRVFNYNFLPTWQIYNNLSFINPNVLKNNSMVTNCFDLTYLKWFIILDPLFKIHCKISCVLINV